MSTGLEHSIHTILYGNGNDHLPTSACSQSLSDRLKLTRIAGLYRKGGLAAIKDEEDLYKWALQEFEVDPSCFEFKLWLTQQQ